jgi:hypothetical protein
MSDEGTPRAPRPRGFSEVIREAKRVVESAGLDLQELAETVVSSAKELADAAADSDVWAAAKQGGEQVRQAASRASSSARIAIDRASTNARELSVQVRHLFTLLDSAADVDRPTLVERLIEAAPMIAAQLDARADAVVVGELGEAGVGLQAVRGTELRYVRGPQPTLVVLHVEGRGARLAVGAARLAYGGCLYGPHAQLLRPLTRRGADVGVALAGFRFFRATTPENQPLGGWWLVLSAGLNLGVPILSDLGAFELGDRLAQLHALTPDEVTRIEAALAEAPDRAWRRGMAESLAR